MADCTRLCSSSDVDDDCGDIILLATRVHHVEPLGRRERVRRGPPLVHARGVRRGDELPARPVHHALTLCAQPRARGAALKHGLDDLEYLDLRQVIPESVRAHDHDVPGLQRERGEHRVFRRVAVGVVAELEGPAELVLLVRRPVAHLAIARVAPDDHKAAVADIRAVEQAVRLVDGGDARRRAPLHALLPYSGVCSLEQVLGPVFFKFVLVALALHLGEAREYFRGEAHQTPAELPGVDTLPPPHVHAVGHAKGDHVFLAVDFG
mmetsp:Transcript_10990/g.44264  ORF Transcript_10990/g.44264 Transcript_10990/m.44264 type:complete len:265 (-) Transcript_10990:1128-1922(-)